MGINMTELTSKQNNIIQKKTMSISEFCEEYNIGKNKAYEIVSIDDFPKIKNGRKYLIIRALIDKWLEENIGIVF